jgi:hypothetical protein
MVDFKLKPNFKYKMALIQLKWVEKGMLFFLINTYIY